MEIGAPTYIASETLYIFPFKSSTVTLPSKVKYIETTDFPDAPDVTEGTAKKIIEDIVEDFIEKTKRYFQTPLRTKTILSRLNHVWEGIPFTNQSITPGWYSVAWEPTKLKIGPRAFTLVWKSGELIPDQPVIPSEYLAEAESRSPSPAPEVRTIQIQQGSGSGNGLLELEPDFSESNDSSRMVTLEYEAPHHRLEKKKIREAKLRAALAALKAERLAEKYYQKYGTLPGDDSSDLSSDSEVEDS